jgi:UDP-arabinose 4-epimerase
MQPILVTGGAGFIGSHTCKALAAHGFHPIAFDNLSRGYRELVQWGPLVRGDILQPADLDRAFERYQPKSIIHFAALAYVHAPLTVFQTPSPLPKMRDSGRSARTGTPN